MKVRRCPSCTKVVHDKPGVGTIHWCGDPRRANLAWWQPHDTLGVIIACAMAVVLAGGCVLGIYLRMRGQ